MPSAQKSFPASNSSNIIIITRLECRVSSSFVATPTVWRSAIGHDTRLHPSVSACDHCPAYLPASPHDHTRHRHRRRPKSITLARNTKRLTQTDRRTNRETYSTLAPCAISLFLSLFVCLHISVSVTVATASHPSQRLSPCRHFPPL